MVIAGEAGTLLVSADGGRSWTAVESPYKGSFFGLQTTADGALLAYGLRGNIVRSTDFGRIWTTVHSDSSPTLQGGTRLPNGEIVLVGSAGAVLHSTDNGLTFRRLSGHRAATFSAVLPTTSGALLLGEGGASDYVPPAGAPAVRNPPANGDAAKAAPAASAKVAAP